MKVTNEVSIYEIRNEETQHMRPLMYLHSHWNRDEFVIVLPDQISDEHACQVVKRILAAVARPIRLTT